MATSVRSRVGLALIPVAFVGLVTLVLVFGTNACPMLGQNLQPAIRMVNRCAPAVALLGAPIRRASIGCANGQYHSRGATGDETWTLSVEGPRGRGRYTYAAEEHGGRWRFTEASLQAFGKAVDVLQCSATAPVGR